MEMCGTNAFQSFIIETVLTRREHLTATNLVLRLQ